MRRHLDAVADRMADPQAWGRFLLRVGLVLGVVACTGVLLAASVAPSVTLAATALGTVDAQVFDFPPLPEVRIAPAERSVILARDGSTLAVLHDTENRVIVRLRDIPRHVQDAVIATEDADFRSHEGVNWRAVARAAVGNVRAGEITSGASTITQQLVKNLVIEDPEQTLDRKLREAAYAVQLEQRLSKDEILEAYLNEAYFGNGVYGIATAAEFYFGEPVDAIDAGQAAMLAGLIRAPSTNDPVVNAEAARLRRDIVLGQMAEHGFLSVEQVARFRALPLRLDITPLPEPSEPFFVAYVRQQLEADPALGADRIARQRLILRGGLEIRTTLDPVLQDLADDAIRSVLDDVDGPQAALPVVDPQTGELLAIGFGPRTFGKGPGQTEVNPAVPGLGSTYGQQPGSSFKAFMLVAAVENGLSPGYTIDTPSPYRPSEHCAGVGWTPGNYSDGGGGIMDMAQATARSSNVYFSHLVDTLGPDVLIETATRMGIRGLEPGICSTVLGGQEVFPLDMASAYGVLANEGVRCEPYAIAAVVDSEGRTLSEGDGGCAEVVEPAVARRVTSLLRGPIEHGTASRNGRIGRPAAGKTGTTDSNYDAWFVGYIPQLSAAVWVGDELDVPLRDPRCGGDVTGGCLPAMIWARFMRGAVDALDLPVVDFPPAPPLPTAPVPDVRGAPVADATPVLRDAGFSALVTTVADYRTAGTVVEQTPGAGSRAERGSTVVLAVSDGLGERPVMPSLLGLTREEAAQRLAELDIAATIVEVPVEFAGDYGVVVGQDPDAGTEVDPATAVTVELGRERRPGDPAPAATASPTASPSSSPSPSPSPEPSASEPPPTPTPSDDGGILPVPGRPGSG